MTVPEPPASRLTAFEPFRSRAAAILEAELPSHLDRLRWNGAKLRSLQEQRLRQILTTATTRSPFHARRLAGLDPQRCGLDDLASLPAIERALAGAGVPTPRASVNVVERLPIDPATGKIARFVPIHRPRSTSSPDLQRPLPRGVDAGSGDVTSTDPTGIVTNASE